MNEQIDSGIPVLTEIISPDEVIAESNAAPAPAAPAPAAAPVIAAAAAPAPSISTTEITPQASSGLSAEEWQQLEQTVKEGVLRQVLSRIDFVLEHRVSDSLAEVLQVAVDKLADDIRAGLRQSLEEVVTRAVTQELSKIKVPRQ
ncbi:MAG: hypothetical protein HYR92_00020 [Burkholderiales bacterium]|nr:hypothetical protein [Burkholderiales bacterium]